MLRVDAFVPRGITAIGALQASVEAFVEVGSRLWKKDDLPLVNLIDLPRGL
jgi:hypothetical protein